jgi:hypothetical protein
MILILGISCMFDSFKVLLGFDMGFIIVLMFGLIVTNITSADVSRDFWHDTSLPRDFILPLENMFIW